jgi:hypothetical protein
LIWGLLFDERRGLTTTVHCPLYWGVTGGSEAGIGNRNFFPEYLCIGLSDITHSYLLRKVADSISDDIRFFN